MSYACGYKGKRYTEVYRPERIISDTAVIWGSALVRGGFRVEDKNGVSPRTGETFTASIVSISGVGRLQSRDSNTCEP